jgi:hypothetical protein
MDRDKVKALFGDKVEELLLLFVDPQSSGESLIAGLAVLVSNQPQGRMSPYRSEAAPAASAAH